MEGIKYFTSKTFNSRMFCDMLNKSGVPAYATDGGIIMDREAFNAIPAAHLPHWAFINRDWINNEFHTRSATDTEKALLTAPRKYAMVVTVGDGKGSVTVLDNGRADSLEVLTKAAEAAASTLRNTLPDFLSVTIVGIDHGEPLKDGEILMSIN